MKKTTLSLLIATALLGSLLTACSGDKNNNGATPPATNTPIASESPTPSPSPSDEPENTDKPDDNKTESSSTDKIMNAMLEKEEQAGLMDLTMDNLDTYYVIDTDLIDEFSIKTPAFNLSSNEIAIIKVKDSKDIAEIKKSMEQRGADVQKMFENYLPEPYKLAQNYKIAIEGDYVLFVISEKADELEKAFKEAAAGA